jgi:murein DD-endopeptidase MepM/ murein hydrolase activator NlpD
MRRLAAAAALLVLALGTASASADTFTVVTDSPEAVLPSAETPNETGSLLLPPDVFEAPFLPVRELAYEELETLWLRAGAAYGIPWQVLAAINKIESNFGRNMGPSSAGAVGWMQFIPDTWQRWGVDASGDGIADPWNPEDAVFAAARYLAAAGGRDDVPRSIFAYNHAQWYVDDVLQLAALFGGGDPGGTDVVFSLDRLAVALEEAQASVAALSEQLAAAEAVEAEAAAKAERLALVADDLDLLVSERAVAAKDAFDAAQEYQAATAEAALLRGELEQAQATLESARDGAHSASFMPAAAGVLRMPTRADGYVFPVAGGPSVVSVAHDHHDYPAADIAAPSGAPVYALADGVVVAAWHSSDGRCGIGFTFRSGDGQTWTYCHLSFLQPSVSSGRSVEAGALVGLVGSTGHSTGPHLHLQLRPATSYPHAQAWFEQFAGIAFRWQDAPTPERRALAVTASAPANVFQVVEEGELVEFTR